MPGLACPPYSTGHDMPSHPRAASAFMNTRRSGESTSWAMPSRVGSVTSGDECSRMNSRTSRWNRLSSSECSKSTARPYPSPASDFQRLGGRQAPPDERHDLLGHRVQLEPDPFVCEGAVGAE